MVKRTVCLLMLCALFLTCAQCIASPAPPTISSFTPASAAICNTVTIKGTGFTGATAVSFSGVAAKSFRVVDDATITAVVPDTTSGKITVTTPNGSCDSVDDFTFIPYPRITSFSPLAAGKGATVNITGLNYTGATSVKFNGVPAKFTINSATSITATVPITSSGKITISSRGGICASPSAFTFVPNPTISSFSPYAAGKGGTVAITGTNFTGATSVMFNGVPGKFTVNSATSITATVPITSSGKITVTTAGGICASPSALTFVPNPTISSFSPYAAGKGATVSITGTNLTGATAIKFNGVPAKFTINSATSITATVPTTSSGKITVTTAGGICASPTVFTFVQNPTISSFSPYAAGKGGAVTITGTNLTGATAVKFNGVPGRFTVNSPTSISAVVPTTSTGKITVTTAGGICASPSVFTFIPNPTITSFSPMTVGKNTTVTITGTDLTGATSVNFNGVAAQSFSVVDASTITAVVPQTTSGKIVVTTPGGVCASPAAFTFVSSPTVTSFSPTSGGPGDSVNITGTNLTGATAVKFNGTDATFSVVSATSITTVVPSGATTGPISVTTPGGTATSASSFTVATTAAGLIKQGQDKVNQVAMMEPFDATTAKTYLQQAESLFDQAKTLEPNNALANFGLAITDAAITAQTLIDKYQSAFTQEGSNALSSLKYTIGALQVLNVPSMVASGKEPLNGVLDSYVDSVKEPMTRGDGPDPQVILNMQTDVKNTVRPMLSRVAGYLDIVEANGGSSFSFPIGTSNWDDYKKIDLGDVYLFHGALLAARWALAIPVSYNLNIGTFDFSASADKLDTNGDGLLSTSEYLPAAPFGNLTDSATMLDAKNDMTTAADKIIAGINATLAETSDDYDLIAWHTPDAGPTQTDLLNARDYATSLKTSMSSATTFSWQDGEDTKSIVAFLGAWNTNPPASLTSMMPAQEVIRWYNWNSQTFEYDMDIAEGGFPDATFGGMFPNGMPGVNDSFEPCHFSTGFSGDLLGISTTPANGATGVATTNWSADIYFSTYPPANFNVTLQRYFAGKWRGEMLDWGYASNSSLFHVYANSDLWPSSNYRIIITDEATQQTYTAAFTTQAD